MSNHNLENNLGIDYLQNNFNFQHIFSEHDIDSFNNDILDDINISCNYFDPESFSSNFKENKNLSVLSLNVQSLSSKWQSLYDLISFWKEKNIMFDLICLQETYSVPLNSIFSLPGYHDKFTQCKTNIVGKHLGWQCFSLL